MSTILDEAAELTSGDRNRDYGHPSDNHGCTAALWTAYLVRCGWTPPQFPEESELSVRNVCMLNALQKISRDAHRPKRDNLVDIAGYMRNVEMDESRDSDDSPCLLEVVEVRGNDVVCWVEVAPGEQVKTVLRGSAFGGHAVCKGRQFNYDIHKDSVTPRHTAAEQDALLKEIRELEREWDEERESRDSDDTPERKPCPHCAKYDEGRYVPFNYRCPVDCQGLLRDTTIDGNGRQCVSLSNSVSLRSETAESSETPHSDQFPHPYDESGEVCRLPNTSGERP